MAIFSAFVWSGLSTARRSAVDASVASVRRVVIRASESSQTSIRVAWAGPSRASSNCRSALSTQFITTVIFIPSGVRYVCVKLSSTPWIAWPIRT